MLLLEESLPLLAIPISRKLIFMSWANSLVVTGRQMLAPKRNEAISITKVRANISWDKVGTVLGNSIKRRIVVFPFLANKAVWWPSNKSEFSYFIKLKRDFFDSRVMLLFEEWSPDIYKSEKVQECCNSWIRIFDLPWILWTAESFKIIGERCGGLLEISEDSSHFRDLRAAKFKVRGIEGGFIKSEMNIQIEAENFQIKIEVDSFDSAVFEQYERQTYAQVVVNGVKSRAGWGNSRIQSNQLGVAGTNMQMIFVPKNISVQSVNTAPVVVRSRHPEPGSTGVSQLKAEHVTTTKEDEVRVVQPSGSSSQKIGARQ